MATLLIVYLVGVALTALGCYYVGRKIPESVRLNWWAEVLLSLVIGLFWPVAACALVGFFMLFLLLGF